MFFNFPFQRSQRVTNHRQGGNAAIICVKMASVMGVTWILGIAANLKALSFLWYPYVILNSLQGMSPMNLVFGDLDQLLNKTSSKEKTERQRFSETAVWHSGLLYILLYEVIR